MVALVASSDGVLEPASARAPARPVLLMQGGIHAGEIDGKDAGFLALREMLDGTAPAARWSAVTLVFVPVFNVDGHERFGPEPAQPARPRGDGLAHHRPEPEPEPRLGEGRRARDGGDAAPDRATGTRSIWSICTSPTAPSSSTTSP